MGGHLSPQCEAGETRSAASGSAHRAGERPGSQSAPRARTPGTALISAPAPVSFFQSFLLPIPEILVPIPETPDFRGLSLPLPNSFPAFYFVNAVNMPEVQSGYAFTGLIRCGKCKAPYKRKHAAAGSKYEKIVWICKTFNELGKEVCDSQQIPESIPMEKTAEIMGLTEFDAETLRLQIAEIIVPEHNKLVYVFHDGLCVEAEWQNPSRRHSWTEEMKQAARERQLKIAAERRNRNE
jgi:hypothetical protein